MGYCMSQSGLGCSGCGYHATGGIPPSTSYKPIVPIQSIGYNNMNSTYAPMMASYGRSSPSLSHFSEAIPSSNEMFPKIQSSYGIDDSHYNSGSDSDKRKTTSIPQNQDNYSGFMNENAQEIFLNDNMEIMEMVKRTFKLTTGMNFPDTIKISLLNPVDFSALHEKMTNEKASGVAGFSVNNPNSTCYVYVKTDSLDKMMIVLGHEIGHVLSYSLVNNVNEEAKAFAFQLAWVKVIHENNIGNLAFNLNPLPPAENGLHNVAYRYVLNQLNQGDKAIDVYSDIIKGNKKISIEDAVVI